MRTRHKPYSILCPNASPPSLPSPFFPNLQSSWAGAPLGQPSYFANWGKKGDTQMLRNSKGQPTGQELCPTFSRQEKETDEYTGNESKWIILIVKQKKAY